MECLGMVALVILICTEKVHECNFILDVLSPECGKKETEKNILQAHFHEKNNNTPHMNRALRLSHSRSADELLPIA